jgi:hypothetical protein
MIDCNAYIFKHKTSGKIVVFATIKNVTEKMVMEHMADYNFISGPHEHKDIQQGSLTEEQYN